MAMLSNIIRFILALLLLSACGAPANKPASDSDYDIVILNGRVIDPETGLDAIRNVGLRGDKITAVTTDLIAGKQTIDATGKVVAPGFVDLHAHGQNILGARVQALDGVTTGLDLEAGTLPVRTFYAEAAAEGRPIHYGASVSWVHARIAQKTGTEPTVGLTYMFSKLGDRNWQDELADEAEMSGILARVQEGLDEGGLGIGFLLGYSPGSGRKEYHAVNQLAQKNNVPTFTHARYLSAVEPKSSYEGYQEMIAVAASTGAHMHICHLNSMSLRDIDDISAIISKAQENGVRITVEAYPYGAGSTGIGSPMFRGERWQARMGGVKKSDFTLAGTPLTDEKFDRLQAEAPGTIIVVHTLDPDGRSEDQDLLDKSLLFPGGVIASDGGTWADPNGMPYDPLTWPLPEDANAHPRAAGTYSRFLRIYVREREKISLLDAITRVSFRPAQILEDTVPQMRNKGRIQVGADADVVVFDLSIVSDAATFDQPAQPSIGFEYVIVAGAPLVKDGILDTEVLPGRPIRRN